MDVDDDCFDSFERKPIENGSIAQTIEQQERPILLKVRHPKVGTRLRLDVTHSPGARCLEVFRLYGRCGFGHGRPVQRQGAVRLDLRPKNCGLPLEIQTVG